MSNIIWVDGGCLGNEGPEENRKMYGSFFYSSKVSVTPFGNPATNNVAEYKTLIEALTFADIMRIESPEFRMDSKLVVNQVNGLWQIKQSHLKQYCLQARELLHAVGGRLVKVPREEIFKVLGH